MEQGRNENQGQLVITTEKSLPLYSLQGSQSNAERTQFMLEDPNDCCTETGLGQCEEGAAETRATGTVWGEVTEACVGRAT